MKKLTLVVLLLCVVQISFAQRKTDKLDRGLVAIPANANGGNSSGNFVSWRILADEYYGVTYNLYANGSLLKEGLKVSNYSHSAGTSSTQYQVAAVVKGKEQELSAKVTRWNNGYLDIPVAKVLDRNGNDVTSQYILNDISLGDVDGDGVVEFLVKRNYTGSDLNTTGNTTKFHHYECYNLNGERLWWIDLGPNMMAGADEQWDIVLFDWDQDGKAEGIMRGADNMIIHTSKGETINVGDMTYVAGRHQYTCEGNEYLLYINGQTGELYNISGNASKPWIAYPLPRFENGESDYVSAWGGSTNGGHDGGHRSSKHYFGAPYLDGRHASIFLGRGCYTRHKMVALDVDPVTHKLTERWRWTNNNGWSDPWFGNGFHNFGIADVDWDGRDEIVFGSMVIDDNGKGLSTTGLGHGDAQHCGDFDPYRHGQEIFTCNEDEPNMNYRNATTSKMYVRSKGTGDDGRALMGNFSNSFPGCMGRSVNTGLISSVADKELTGTNVPSTGGTNDGLFWSHLNFRIYWTGDLIEGILDSPGTEREAVVWTTTGGRVFQSSGCQMNNDSKNNPCAMGDILGDWREEIVLRADGNTKIRIYTTPQSTSYRIPNLWSDHQYRNAMVWQPVGYNQPPHVSFFLGQMEGITVAPPPLTMEGRTEIQNGGTISAANAGQHVIVCETNDTRITVADGANPDVVTFNVPSWVQGTNSNKTDGSAVINRTYYTCTVEGGAFTGSTTLAKQGDGILSLPKVDMTYAGPTNIWAGTLNFDGSLNQSMLWLNRFAELNSSGTFRCIKADYAAVIRPGGENAQGCITADSLVMGFGSRLQLDAYSEGLKIDQVNTKYLSIERKTGTVWETYGPQYLMPVVEVVAHGEEGSNQLTPGKYLIGSMETLKGSLDNVKIEGISSQKAYLQQEEGKLYLVIEGIRDAGIVYWTGAKGATWNYADVENFQSLEGDPDIFVTGDKVIFDDAAKRFTVTLTGELDPDTVIVDNTKAYTFNGTGSLVGGTSLVKRGTGSLTISNDNTYTGKTIISGGTVKVSNLSNENKAYGNLGAVSTKNTNFVIENGATLQTTAAVEMGTPIRLQGESGGVLNTGADFAMNQSFIGTTLTKSGTGTLICYKANPSLSRMVITAGSVAERAGNAASTIELQGGTLYDDAQSTTHAIYVPKGKSATWQLTSSYYTAYENKITGEGTLTIIPRNTVSRVRITGDWSQFEGTIKHTTTGIWLPLDATSGIPKGTLNLAAGCTVTNVCKSFTIGCLTGSGSLAQPVANFQNSSAVSGNNTWNVGNSLDKDFSFAGTITDNGSSNKVLFNKVGTCKMTFTGSGDFQGACQVKAGELCLNSSKSATMLGTGKLTVSNGATLSGKGTLGNSSVIVNKGGILRSGTTETNTVGNLNFGGKDVTVNGTLQTCIGSKTSFGRFTNISALTLNGKLVVRGTEDLALSVGDEIQLFDASAITLGTALELELCEPNVAMGLTWDTSRLNEGILIVAPAPDAVMSLHADELCDAEIFTLIGVRLQKRPSQAGLYLVNGRKLLLK
ncbi:MAG: autotransporter-associated beta strand repeat-containing protein [Bacteroidaceae bacterium]|nr:autotransporter-associated beta strand repeat-containing protein [Bacteroidaceae bacterium]